MEWFHISGLFLSNFPTNLPFYFKRFKNLMNRKIWSIFLIQNFISFLLGLFLFAVGQLLWLKNSNKVESSEIWLQNHWIFNLSTKSVFFSLKKRPTAKMIESIRKLVKFWTRKMLHIFLFIIFWNILK